MADEEDLSSETGENTMLREAIESLRTGDRVRARDLLTRLLKADQKNAENWVWLSAVFFPELLSRRTDWRGALMYILLMVIATGIIYFVAPS